MRTRGLAGGGCLSSGTGRPTHSDLQCTLCCTGGELLRAGGGEGEEFAPSGGSLLNQKYLLTVVRVKLSNANSREFPTS